MSSTLSSKEKVRLETDLRRRLVRLYIGGWALRKRDGHLDKIQPYYCKSCGYIALYKEKKE